MLRPGFRILMFEFVCLSLKRQLSDVKRQRRLSRSSIPARPTTISIDIYLRREDQGLHPSIFLRTRVSCAAYIDKACPLLEEEYLTPEQSSVASSEANVEMNDEIPPPPTNPTLLSGREPRRPPPKSKWIDHSKAYLGVQNHIGWSSPA